MSRISQLAVLIVTVSTHMALAQGGNATKNTQSTEKSVLELSRFEVIPIKDNELERTYDLYIKLPESYSEDKNAVYPVIYFTDAAWHLEILSASTEYMLEDVILVGISWQKNIDENLKREIGEHLSRFRDYSMRKSNDPKMQTKYQFGGANEHLNFIRNHVIRYVEDTYRTDPRSRTYFGYSLGGEFGAYVLLTQPQTFHNYILGSPSIKNEVPDLTELNAKLETARPNKDNSLHANVFVSHGTLEEAMEGPIEAFIALLKRRRDRGLSMQSEIIEGNHQSAFPLTAVQSVAWLATIIDPTSNSVGDLSFFDIPQRNRSFISIAPEDRKDGIAVGEVGVDGGDKEKLLQLAQEITDKKHGYYDSFLMYHKDKLIFESYHSRGRMDLPHPQASATKAYTGMALGRAIQLGYLTMEDLDKPLINFLKNLDPSRMVEGAEKITLAKALTMRSGIRVSEEDRKTMEQDSSGLLGQGQVQQMLEYSAPITEASQRFEYKGDPDLVMQVLEAVVPNSAKDFIKTELLDKLGITHYEWHTAPSGIPEAGWRTSFTSRDMVKWGILAMDKGKWKGEQLISKAFIDKGISRILLTGDDDVFGGGKDVSRQGYGYYWWSADLKHGKHSYFSTSAQGGGGQYIILVEELDLMIVVTAHDGDNTTLQLVAERILPAFYGNQVLQSIKP